MFETILSCTILPMRTRIRGWVRLAYSQESEQLVVLLTEVDGEGHHPMIAYMPPVIKSILPHVGRPLPELLILYSAGHPVNTFAELTFKVEGERLHHPDWRDVTLDEVAMHIGDAPTLTLWSEQSNGSWVCTVGAWRGVAFPRGTPIGHRWESHVLNRRVRLNHSGPTVGSAQAARLWVLDIIANMSREHELWPGEAVPVWTDKDDESW